MNRSNFQGWEDYPNNSLTISEDQFAYDYESYKERLTLDSKRLFVPENTDNCVQVIENRASRKHFRDLER